MRMICIFERKNLVCDLPLRRWALDLHSVGVQGLAGRLGLKTSRDAANHSQTKLYWIGVPASKAGLDMVRFQVVIRKEGTLEPGVG